MRSARQVLVGLAIAVLLAACVGPGASGEVATLARLPGWADHHGDGLGAFSVVEVAYDADAVERLWTSERVAELAGTLEPQDRAVDLEDVDLATHVVVVWSGGSSSSCSARVTHLRGTGDAVVVRQPATTEACTADYVPVRLVLAVPRADLPEAAALPVRLVDEEGHERGEVRLHPASSS